MVMGFFARDDVIGAQAGRNAVENSNLCAPQLDEFAERARKRSNLKMLIALGTTAASARSSTRKKNRTASGKCS